MKKLFLCSCCAVVGFTGLNAGAQASSFVSILDFVPETPIMQTVSADKDAVAAGAERFIADLTSQGVSFLADSSLSSEKRKAEFKRLLNNKFDMNTIARFSLGRHWRSASKEQRDEYMALFKTMIVDVYSQRFNNYQGQTIEVTGSRQEGEHDVLVRSTLEQDSGPDVKLDWRVRKKGKGYKVVDVIVEGVSMALTQRSDFSSVIQRGGGNMEALLTHLRRS